MATETTKVNFVEGAAASTPAASRVVIYSKSDGLMYSKDDAGTETLMSGGAGGGSVATDAIWDAAGDLVQGTGANTAAKLTAGTAGNFLKSAGAAAANVWAFPPGHELDYVEFTSPVAITATTEGGANTVVTGTSQSYDGTAIWVEFFSPRVIAASLAGAGVLFNLQDGGTVLGYMGFWRTPAAAANAGVVLARRKLTPSAGTHQYIIKAWRITGDGSVEGGPGGTGNDVPGYIRVTKA